MQIKAQIDRMMQTDSKVKAYASVNLDGEFVLKDIAVVEGKNGPFARMPYRTYKDRDGSTQYADVFFALTDNARTAVNEAVVQAYEQQLQAQPEQTHGFEQSM